MAVIIVGIVGLIGLLGGWLPVSLSRRIRGKRARLSGCVLLLPIPLGFIIGGIAGFWVSTLNVMDYLTNPMNSLLRIIQFVQIPLIVFPLILTLIVAYWPSRLKADTTLISPFDIQHRSMITIKDAANRFNVKPETLCAWLQSAQIPTVAVRDTFEVERLALVIVVHRRWAIQHVAEDNLHEAIAELDEVIRLEPKIPDNYFLRGKVYWKAGQPYSAYQDFQTVSRLRADYPRIDAFLSEARKATQKGSSLPKQFAYRLNSSLIVLSKDLRNIPLALIFIVFVFFLYIGLEAPETPEAVEQICSRSEQCIVERGTDTFATVSAYTAAPPPTASAQAAGTMTQVRNTQEKSRIITQTAFAPYVQKTNEVIQLTKVMTLPSALYLGQILFIRDSQLFLMDTSRQNVRPIPIGGFKSIQDVAWSKGGTQITFVSSGVDTKNKAKRPTSSVYVANLDGTNLRQLTLPEQKEVYWYWSPTWSPDGRSIALLVAPDSPHNSTTTKSTLYIVDIANNKWNALDTFSDTVTSLSWSPDGQFIAYCKKSDTFKNPPTLPGEDPLNIPGAEIATLIMRVDHPNASQRGFSSACHPDWSPDSQKITLIKGAGESRRLYVVDIPTGQTSAQMRQLTNIAVEHASWSPDGRHIIFNDLYRQSSSVFHQNIFIVDVKDESIYNVTQNSTDKVFYSHPIWRP